MAEKKVYGASRETWRTYVDNGWGSMMLPVVSDPNAKIDAASKLGSLGKTPSVLTPSGTVVGLLKWTQMPITPQQIAVWEGRGYGISLRCGTIVAFDCDVDSPELANSLLDEFSLTFGDGFPVRRRKNSARWLAVFKITEPISKGRVVFPGGDMLEVLCAGQQFIAEGTHPSGSRYTWSEPLVLSRLPFVTPESVFDFMEGVAKRYNAELQRGEAVRPSRGRNDRNGGPSCRVASRKRIRNRRERRSAEHPLPVGGLPHEQKHRVRHVVLCGRTQRAKHSGVQVYARALRPSHV